jgi:hypothetical protein
VWEYEALGGDDEGDEAGDGEDGVFVDEAVAAVSEVGKVPASVTIAGFGTMTVDGDDAVFATLDQVDLGSPDNPFGDTVDFAASASVSYAEQLLGLPDASEYQNALQQPLPTERVDEIKNIMAGFQLRGATSTGGVQRRP